MAMAVAHGVNSDAIDAFAIWGRKPPGGQTNSQDVTVGAKGFLTDTDSEANKNPKILLFLRTLLTFQGEY